MRNAAIRGDITFSGVHFSLSGGTWTRSDLSWTYESTCALSLISLSPSGFLDCISRLAIPCFLVLSIDVWAVKWSETGAHAHACARMYAAKDKHRPLTGWADTQFQKSVGFFLPLRKSLCAEIGDYGHAGATKTHQEGK